MDIRWRMPEVTPGMKRSQIGPCRVRLGADIVVAEFLSALLKVSIISARSTTGLAAVVAQLRADAGMPEFTQDEISRVVEGFWERHEMVVDYWGGWPVKLSIRVDNSDCLDIHLEISVNAWADRQMSGCDMTAATRELEEVLQAVKSL